MGARYAWMSLLLIFSATAGCAVIPPGFAGVLLTPSAGVRPTALPEGVHVISPLAQVELYDLRGQERDEDLRALTADGAPIAARTSLVTYHLVPDELSTIARQIGPDYYRILIQPIVRSTVRRVLAGYLAAQLDSASIVRAQQAITKLAAERLRPYHIGLDSIDLRTLAVVLSVHSYATVIERGVLEQQVLTRAQLLELARQRAEARREAARAVASAHALIAPSLTPDVLIDSRRRAETQLLTAAATAVVITDPHHPFAMEVVP